MKAQKVVANVWFSDFYGAWLWSIMQGPEKCWDKGREATKAAANAKMLASLHLQKVGK